MAEQNNSVMEVVLDQDHLPSKDLLQNPFSIVAKTIKGENHEVNEDALFQSDNGLVAVFDGLGGHADGHLASQIALKVCQKMSREFKNDHLSTMRRHVVESILLAANQDIKDKSVKLQNNMGTTAVLAYIDQTTNEICCHSAGDSRVYRLRDGILEQISTDDNTIKGLLESKHITTSQAKQIQLKLDNLDTEADLEHLNPTELFCFQNRNIVKQYLGQKEPLKFVETRVDYQPGDIVLVLSDGISDNLTLKQMNQIVSDAPNNAQIAAALLEQAQIRSRHYSDESSGNHDPRCKPDDMSIIVLSGKPEPERKKPKPLAESDRNFHKGFFESLKARIGL